MGSWRRAAPVLLLALLVHIAGCGGGGSDSSPAVPSTISGRVMDGYIRGATVFWDCNDNFVADAGELAVVSEAGGRYTIGAAPSPPCQLRAFVPATAVDEDTSQPVGYAFRMASVSGAPELISPFTTAVSLGFSSAAALQARFAASVGLPVTGDYVAAAPQAAPMHNVAKYLTVALQSVDGLVSSGDPAARKSALALAFAFVPPTAYASADVTPAALSAFRQDIAQVSTANATLATLDKAEFVLVESAFTGPADPRRAIVNQALETVRKYPDAVSGNVINWALVPVSARSTWSQQMVDGVNGFADSAEVKRYQSLVRNAQAQADAEIQAESAKVVKKMATVFAKNIANMTATSIDSAIKILPATNVAARAIGITKTAKLKTLATTAVTKVGRVTSGFDFAANCTGLATSLASIVNVDEFAPATDLVDVGVSIAKCAGGLIDSEALKLVAEGVASGKAYYEGAAEADLLKAAEAVTSLAAAVLDVGQQPVASALVSETTLYFLTKTIAINELNKTGVAALTAFDQAAAAIRERLMSQLDDASSAIINARLVSYIRPLHLINITVPTAAQVGQDVAVLIDQRLAQPIAYRLHWDHYPNGNDVATDTTWATAGGSTTLPAVRYLLPGTYRIVIELSDNSLGVPIAPFQILSQDIVVDCPANTAPDPDGVCMSTAPAVVTPTFVAASPSRLEVTFSQPMAATYFTTGNYVPSTSVWESPTRFVVTFSSVTPGGTITLKAPTVADPRGFKSIAGVGLAQDYVFQFPATPPLVGPAPKVTSLNFVAAVPSRLEVNFDQAMRPGYGTTGGYVPASSVWETSTRFVITFNSVTPGGSITLQANSFASAAGTAMASDVTFTFPADSGALAVRWTFDDCTGADSSGNGRTAVLNGGPTCEAGRSGNALRFSGIDVLDNVVPQWLALPRNPGPALTFATWFKWEPTTGYRSSGLNESIWSIGDTQSDTNSTGIWISNATSRSLFAYGTSGTPAIAVPGEWMHVAFTSDGKVSKLYVNGEYVHEVIHTTPINLTGQPQYISSFERQGFPTLRHVFSGLIDNAQLYNRVLTADEVRSVYRNP